MPPSQSSTITPQPEHSTLNPKPSTVFADYARYYDLLYRDKDYNAEADYVAGLINRFNPDAKSVLELGSGTGIHAMQTGKENRVYGKRETGKIW